MNEFDLRKYLYSNPLLEKKEDSKKGNKEEQKRMKGAIEDDADHIEKLKKDLKADKKKLAKLKKDEPKDVKEGFEYEEDGTVDEVLALSDEDDTESTKEAYAKYKEDSVVDEVMELSDEDDIDVKKEGMSSSKMRKYRDRGVKGGAEERATLGDEEKINKMRKGEEPKLTREGLKDMIREKITSILNEESIEEQKDVEVRDKENVDIDIEKDVEVDDVSKETDIDVKTSLPGESEDVDAVLGLLTKAKEESERFAAEDEELGTQIGNVITYFTRKHVAK